MCEKRVESMTSLPFLGGFYDRKPIHPIRTSRFKGKEGTEEKLLTGKNKSYMTHAFFWGVFWQTNHQSNAEIKVHREGRNGGETLTGRTNHKWLIHDYRDDHLPVPSAADDHAIRDDKLAHIVLVSSQHLPRFNFNPYSPMSKRPLDAKF